MSADSKPNHEDYRYTTGAYEQPLDLAAAGTTPVEGERGDKQGEGVVPNNRAEQAPAASDPDEASCAKARIGPALPEQEGT